MDRINCLRRTVPASWMLLAAAAALLGGCGGGGDVGSAAPPVAPSRWLNAESGFSWDKLSGRVILVEKWATWCGPCVASIPHLNELHEKYEGKGLTIIAVASEPEAKIEKFVEDRGIDYVVALGGAPGYVTNGIPHAWLVNAAGNIVWEGHPMSLSNGQIEKYLSEVKFQ